jgi:hypothetical protein
MSVSGTCSPSIEQNAKTGICRNGRPALHGMSQDAFLNVSILDGRMRIPKVLGGAHPLPVDIRGHLR